MPRPSKCIGNLTYTLSGSGASLFRIDSGGLLYVNTRLTEGTYNVTVTVADGAGGSASITLIINAIPP